VSYQVLVIQMATGIKLW